MIVLGLALASLLVIVSEASSPRKRLGLDLKGGVQLTYLGKATAQSKVTAESLDRAIDDHAKSASTSSVSPSRKSSAPAANQIDVALPDVSNAARAQEQVGKTAQLFFYDWEPNVIGPNGKPAGPNEPTVTGGTQRRASPPPACPSTKRCCAPLKRPAILRKNDTTSRQAARPSRSAGASTASGTCWTPPTRRCCAAPRTPNKTSTPTATNRRRAQDKDGARQPRHGACRRRSPMNRQGRQGHHSLAGKLVRAQRQSGAQRRRHQEPAPELRKRRRRPGAPDVTFEFTSHGRRDLPAVTREIAQRGQKRAAGRRQARRCSTSRWCSTTRSSPRPRSTTRQYPDGIDPTTGSEITGGFTITSAQNLADELQSGALPIKLELISQSQVSATLGKQALEQGLFAGLIGFAVVCLFLLIFYRVLGAIAVAGLLIYGLYFFALIKLIPITLTLPGIAGLILTIGIAADANIVIFERVKEEIRGGRSITAGIATGYRRGFAAIVDANVVTFMTAFILFALATSEVKGFAFTLGIGTLLTLFTAVLATQAALGAMGRSRAVSHPAMLGASRRRRKGGRIDFMGASKWFFSLSGTILLIGALAIGGRGLNLGIDFKSGTRIQTAFVKSVTENQIRSTLRAAGFGDCRGPEAQQQGHRRTTAFRSPPRTSSRAK